MSETTNYAELILALAKEWRNEEILPILKQLEEWLGTQEEKQLILETSNYLSELKERIAGKTNDTIIPTGFKDIDDRIFGAVKWNIMTICARTGWWKTTLWLNIALNMIKEHKVGFISLEMTEQEIWDKIVSRLWHVRHSALTINKFMDRELDNIKKHGKEIKYAIDNLVRAYDCYDIESLSETITEMAKRWCEVVFVDWIGMIEAPGVSKPEQVRTIMTRLKQLAITNNIAIVTMQQLNRQMDWQNRQPYMYDIADGSAIEKISSPVLIMWRAEDEYTTDISIFKARRLNADNFQDENWRIDWEKAVNLKLKDDLSYSWFLDEKAF